MPPRKRTRTATPAASTPAASSPPSHPDPTPKALPKHAHHAPSDVNQPDANCSPDPWAPEHETALFKAILRHKPTGPHAHFRMLAIRDALAAATGGLDAEHLRIPGIWAKLGGLYDLETIGAQEAELLFGEDRVPDSEEDEEGEGERAERAFALPEFGDGEEGAFFAREMWARRRKSPGEGGSSSPAGSEGDEEESAAEVEVEVRPRRGRGRGGGAGRGRGRGGRRGRGRDAGSVTSRDTEERGIKEEVESGDEAASDGGEDGEDDEEEVPARSTRSAQRRGEGDAERGGRGGRRR